jgi:hypothetical protein
VPASACRRALVQLIVFQGFCHTLDTPNANLRSNAAE